jgi:hypothetical protein
MILIIFYTNYFTEKFTVFDFNNSQYAKINELVPTNLSYPTQSDIDYQDDLNVISGYDGATRSYNNPFYAQQIASGLDTD